MAGRKRDRRSLSKESQAYWEETLRQEGLSVEAGRNRRLVYVGGTRRLEAVHEETSGVIRHTRRKKQAE